MLTEALVLARATYFIAAMLLFGANALRLMMRARLPHIAPLQLTALNGLALAAAGLAACLWFVLAAAQMADAVPTEAILAEALHTLFGTGFMLRMAALVGTALAFAMGGNLLALMLCGVLLAAPALTGHAASSSPMHFTAIGMIIDGLHLLTAGFWLGGLAGLAILFARGTMKADLLLILGLFSETAMVAVLLLVMTGLINAALVLLGGPGRASPLYLAVLGLKLLGVAAMLGLAATNRFRLMPTFGEEAQARLSRNVALELGLGIVVAALAALLGQLAPTLG